MKRTRTSTPKVSALTPKVQALKPRPLGDSLSRLGSIAAIGAALLAGAGVVQAAPFYWDTDGSDVGNSTAGAALGGSGTWDIATTPNWWPDPAAPLTTWANSFSDTAIFTSPFSAIPTVNTVTLTAGIQANKLSFLRSGYILTGGDITLGGATPGIHANFAESATISSQVISTGGFTLSGGGQVRLTNNANSITGTTTLAGGTLVISNNLQLGGSLSALEITVGNPVLLNTGVNGFLGGALLLDGTAGPVTVSRPINLAGFGMSGRSAALVSAGDNTLSGLVSGGVGATVRNSRLTSANGTLTLSGGLHAFGTSATTFTTLGGVSSVGSGNFNLTGPLTGTGSIEKAGSGTLFLNASDATAFGGTTRISGSATVNQSSVRVGTATAFGGNTATTNLSTIDLNGGVLEVRSDASLSFGKAVYQRNNSTIYTGPAAGGSGVNLTSSFGVLHVASNTNITFNSRNGYGVTFNGNTTQENSNNNVTWNNNLGGTLLFANNVWPNSEATTNVRVLTFGGNGNTTVTGSIAATTTGFKTVTKTGTGLLTLIGNAAGAGVNGPTNIQGSLAATDFRSIGSNTSVQLITLGNATTTPGNLIIGTSGTSVLANLVSTRPIVFNGTTNNNAIYANQTLGSPVSLSGAITRPVATTGSVVLGGTSTQENLISSVIPAAGTGGLIKNGAGLWALSGINLYAGPTTITRGTLRLRATAGASDIIPSVVANTVVFNADAVTGDAGGTLELAGFTATATTEALGTLTPTAGAGTVRLTGSGAAANLTFTNATVAAGKGSSVNFDTSLAVGGTVTLTGHAVSTATTLPGNGHLYINGADFARINATAVVVAPVYGTDAGFVNGGAALTAGNHNLVNAAIAAQPAVAVSSLKLTTLNLTLAGLLTVNTGGAANDGGILAAGSSTIAGTGITSGGAGTLVFRSNLAANVLTLNAPITATTTGGFTKNGAGVLIIGGANAQSGATTINEGTVRLAAGGVLSSNSVTSDLVIRQGAILDVNGIGTGTAIRGLSGSGSIVNGIVGTPAAALLQIGNSSGTGVFTGIIGNGTGGALSVTKLGVGGQSLLGSSTYTGVTTIGSTGLLTVNTLALGGVASGIGQSSNAAANLVFNGTTGGLVYAGGLLNGSLAVGSRSATTDRLFTLAGSGATLSSTATNNNAIFWSNTGAIVNSGGANTLLFTGTSAGDNTFNPQLTDVGGVISLTKTAAGQWNLGNTNNTYTGLTTVSDGILGLNLSGALPANSPLVLGTTTTTGILQTSGTFARNLAAVATAGTGTVTFGGTTGGGGFAAHASKLTVTLDGGAGVTWGVGGFVGTGGVQSLSLNSASSLAQVEFTNAIDLGAVVRTVTVADNGNTGADFATLSGVLSGSALGGLTKAGAGMLQLTSNLSSYPGITAVTGGGLTVRSLGLSGVAGTSSVGAVTVGAFDNTNSINLGNAGTTAGVLQYTGAGETSDRKIRLNTTTGATQIHADGTGALILSNVVNDMVAGNKNLNLRGSSMAGNMITSQLSDFTGTLGVVIDGAATWILSNPANNYTGNTAANAGALGIGDNAALGSGALNFNNGTIFAYGADRTLANVVLQNNNVTTAFSGDYNLTFGAVTVQAAGSNWGTTNNIVAGKTLTFGTLAANSLTGNRAWTIDGSGETFVNGDFTTPAASAFGVPVTKTGNGTLILGGAGGGVNNFNRNNQGFDLDRGTLRLGADEVIGHGLDDQAVPVAYGSVTLSPELASVDTATFDLAGRTETINGLTAITDGVAIIDNSSATAANLSVGGNDSTVAFGTGGSGTYSIAQTGGGVINLTKTGTGAANFSGTLGNTGSTTVNDGTMNYNSPTGTTTITVGALGSLNVKAGLTTPGNLTAITLAGGGALSFADNAGTPLPNLTTLSLGLGAGISTLELEAGDLGTDTITLLAPNVATTANTINLLVKDFDITNGSTYNLLVAPSGGLLTGGGSSGVYTFSLAGYSGSFLTQTDTLVSITAGTLITSDVYWAGGVATPSWNTVVPGLPDTTNFSDNLAGTILAATLPGKGQKVIFQADNITGGAALTTQLDQPFKINALEFRQSTVPADTSLSVTIASGVGTNTLTIAPSAPADGINLLTGATPTVNISAPVATLGAQTWTTADAAQNLNLSGALSGTGNVTKAGPGTVTLSAAGTTFTGTFTVNGGNAAMTQIAALSGVTATPGSGSDITIGSGGAFYYSEATARNVPHDITLNGGTLSAGLQNHNYTGAVNVAANSFFNARDNNSPVTSSTGRNVTLNGVLSGSSRITMDSNDGLTAGNQINGQLILSNIANTWNGELAFDRGTAIFTSNPTTVANAGHVGPVSFNAFGRVIYRNLNGQTLNRTGALTYAANSVGEFSADNISAVLAADYVINQTGLTTLGSGGTGATMRLFLADANSAVNLTGGVVLGGPSSISVSGGDADSVVTISGTGISDGGSGYSLAINDEAGAWAVTSSRLAINAAGTYTGGTTLNEGILLLGHKDALGTGLLNITGGSTITPTVDLSGANAVLNDLTLSSNLTVAGLAANPQNLTFDGDLILTGGDANRTLTNNLIPGNTLILSGAASNVGAAANTAGRTWTLAGVANTIISANLADGNAFANGVTVTSTATTTLSGINTYSGTTTMNAAAGKLLLQGSNSSAGPTTLTTGTIQLDSAANGGLASGLLTLTAGTLEPLNAARSLTNNATLGGNITVIGSQNLTIGGLLTNSGGNRTLTSTSTGTLRLASVNLTENTTVARTLTLAGTGAVEIGTLTNNFGNNTISNTGTGVAPLTIDTNVFLSEDLTTGRILTVTGTGNTLISGVIADANGVGVAGGLTKNGTGTLTLSNTNTYTGATNLAPTSGQSRGVIAATANNALGTGPVTVSYVTGAVTGQITLAGGITLGNSSFTTTGAGSDGVTSGLVRNLSGSNTITGDMNLIGGGGGSVYRSDAGLLTFSGNVGALSAGSQRELLVVGAGDFEFSGVLRDSNAGVPPVTDTLRFITLSTGTTTFSGAAANTYTGVSTVTGNLNLNKTAGVNAIAGSGLVDVIPDVVINGGTLRLLANNQIADTVTINQTSGAFRLNGKTETIGTYTKTGGAFSLGIGGSLTLLGNTFTVTGPSTLGDNVIDAEANLTDASVTLQSGAIVEVYGSNALAYAPGPFGTFGGTLQVSTGGSGLTFGAGTNTINLDSDATATDAGKLLLQGDVSTTGTGTASISNVLGGSAAVKGIVDLDGGTRTFTVGSTNPLTISATVTNGDLTKEGDGTLTLTTANTYAGATTINNGIVNIQDAAGLGTTAGGTTVAAGGTLQIEGGIAVGAEAITLNGAGETGQTGALVNVSGANTYAGALTLGSNSTISTDDGSLTLTTASTIVNGGFDLTSTSGTLGTSTVINGDISGAGGLIVSAGDPAGHTLILDPATTNGFTGATTINSDATLEAAGAGALGSTTNVTINTGGSLLLSGVGDRVNDAAAFDLNGGKFNAFGLAETVGSLTLSASSVIDLAGTDLNNVLAFAASNANTWTGTLSIWNFSGIALNAGGGNGGAELDQVFFGNSSAALTSSQLNQITFFSGSGTGNLGTAAFGLNGQIVPVPEPTGILVGLAMFGLAGLRERRRSNARRREERAASRA